MAARRRKQEERVQQVRKRLEEALTADSLSRAGHDGLARAGPAARGTERQLDNGHEP